VKDIYCRDEETNGLACAFKVIGATQCETCRVKDIEETIADIRNIKPTVLPEVSTICKCNDCLSGETALQKQLNHPFYKDADAFRNEIKMETLKKAAVKYPEPFNPFKWTITQLGKHAMAENYDQQNYIYGMFVRLQAQETTINYLLSVLNGIAGAETIPAPMLRQSAKDALETVKGQHFDERI
jgi:hypothetical protein